LNINEESSFGERHFAGCGLDFWASEMFDLSSLEAENWVEDGRKGPDKALRDSPTNVNDGARICRRRIKKPCLCFALGKK